MDEFVIRLNGGDYYEQRGGYDWGRTDRSHATTFDSVEAAQDTIESRGLHPHGGRIRHAYDPSWRPAATA